MIRTVLWPVAVGTSLFVNGVVLLGVSSVLARGIPQEETTIELLAGLPAIAVGVVEAVATDPPVELVATEVALTANGDTSESVAGAPANSEAIVAVDGTQIAEAVAESPVSSVEANEVTLADESPATIVSPDAESAVVQASEEVSVVASPLSSDISNVVSSNSVAAEVFSHASSSASTPASEEADAKRDTNIEAKPIESTVTVKLSDDSPVVKAPLANAIDVIPPADVDQAAIADVVALASRTQVTAVAKPTAEQREASNAVVVDSETVSAAAVDEKGSPSHTAAPVLRDQQATLIPLPRELRPVQPIDHRLAIASFLRQWRYDNCFLAVPQEIRKDGARITGFSPQENDLASFEREFINMTKASLALDRQLITQEQCVTLELVRALSQKESTGPLLQFLAADISDGEELVARISNVKLPFLSLILVDDDGMAVDLSGYVKNVGGGLEFRAPMHLLAHGRGRTQLLIALSAEKSLEMLEFEGQRQAESLFPLALGESRMRKLKTDVGIAAFQVH